MSAFQTVVWELEDVYGCSLGQWDVVCEVECEYDAPDPSVGYRGGWAVNDPDFVAFIEYDADGNELRRLSEEQMHDNDALLCDYIRDLASQRCIADEERIREQAAEQAQGDYEAAQEAAADARRESLIERGP